MLNTLTGIVTLAPVAMLVGIVTPSSSVPSAVAPASGVTLVSASTVAPRRKFGLTKLLVVVVSAPLPFQSPKSLVGHGAATSMALSNTALPVAVK